jgi:hypothetical protein
MADKLRKTFPLNITFSDAEQPDSAKLSAIASQARNGLAIIEKVVGDLWNQSADSVVASFPLQLPNIARMLGEAKYLNPVIFPATNDFYFLEDLNDNWSSYTEGYLRFKPKTLTGMICVNTLSGDSFARVDNEYDLSNNNEYFVDVNTGRFVFFQSIGYKFPRIKYLVSPSQDWIPGNEVLPGVIPDERQTGFVGCRISESGGNYYLHLPPRTPLTMDADETPTNWPSGNQISDNQAASLDTGDRRLWQDPTVAAFDDAHYRYALPKELQDRLASLSVGASLPSGFMYLWDQGNETIVEDATFRKASFGKDWIVQVESSTLDLSTLVSSDETTTSYNSGYSLIVCGAPLARWIWEFVSAFYQHKHDNSGDFSTQMEHKALLESNPPSDEAATEHYGRYPTSLPPWPKSRWEGDDHTSLLSRAGSQGTLISRHRDLNDNAMLGDLVLANRSEVASGVFLDPDCPDESFALRFGAASGLKFHAKDGNTVVLGYDEDLIGQQRRLSLEIDPVMKVPTVLGYSTAAATGPGYLGGLDLAVTAVDPMGGETTAADITVPASVLNGNNDVTLSWDPIPGTSYYKIYFKNEGAGSYTGYSTELEPQQEVLSGYPYGLFWAGSSTPTTSTFHGTRFSNNNRHLEESAVSWMNGSMVISSGSEITDTASGLASAISEDLIVRGNLRAADKGWAYGPVAGMTHRGVMPRSSGGRFENRPALAGMALKIVEDCPTGVDGRKRLVRWKDFLLIGAYGTNTLAKRRISLEPFTLFDPTHQPANITTTGTSGYIRDMIIFKDQYLIMLTGQASDNTFELHKVDLLSPPGNASDSFGEVYVDGFEKVITPGPAEILPRALTTDGRFIYALIEDISNTETIIVRVDAGPESMGWGPAYDVWDSSFDANYGNYANPKDFTCDGVNLYLLAENASNNASVTKVRVRDGVIGPSLQLFASAMNNYPRIKFDGEMLYVAAALSGTGVIGVYDPRAYNEAAAPVVFGSAYNTGSLGMSITATDRYHYFSRDTGFLCRITNDTPDATPLQIDDHTGFTFYEIINDGLFLYYSLDDKIARRMIA